MIVFKAIFRLRPWIWVAVKATLRMSVTYFVDKEVKRRTADFDLLLTFRAKWPWKIYLGCGEF